MFKRVIAISMLITSLLFNSIMVNAQATHTDDIKGSLIDNLEKNAVFEVSSLSTLQNKANINKLTLTVGNISINGDTVSFTGSVIDSKATEFNLSGKLYNSYTQKDGFRAYVADLKDQCNNYDVLYFMVKDDTKAYKYALNKNLQDSNLFVLYLKDKDGNVLAFEDKLEKLGVDFSNVKPADTAPSNIDYLWFTKILKPKKTGEMENNVNTTNATTQKISEPAIDGGVGIQSLHSSSTVTPIIFREWYYGGDEFRESCWAKIYGQIGDMPRYGSANAQTTLKMVEYVYMNDIFYSNDTNYTLQEAGSGAVRDMYGKIALGYNSAVNNFYWDGNYWVWSNFRTSITTALGGGYSTPFVSANLYLNLEFPSDKYNGSSNLKVLYPDGSEYPKNAIQKIAKSQNIWLKNHGDRLDIAANVATIDSGATLNYSTSAQFVWTFDIFYYSEGVQGSYTDYGLSLGYISNAQ